MGGKSERCGSRGWRMKGAALRRIYVLFYRKWPVVRQHTAAQWYASRVFPACLRHLNMVSNLGPTEPPASGPSRFFVCRQECVGSRLEQHIPAGADNGLISSFSNFGIFGLGIPSQETKRLVCNICYPGDMGVSMTNRLLCQHIGTLQKIPPRVFDHVRYMKLGGMILIVLPELPDISLD